MTFLALGNGFASKADLERQQGNEAARQQGKQRDSWADSVGAEAAPAGASTLPYLHNIKGARKTMRNGEFGMRN